MTMAGGTLIGEHPGTGTMLVCWGPGMSEPFLQVSTALAQVRTASGQVLTPPFRPIRDVVIVRRRRVLSLSIFYDVPEELEQLVNSCYGLEPETIA